MYLISIYFDEKTEEKLNGYIRRVAKDTGNDTMLSGKIPPHITISSFYAMEEMQARDVFRKVSAQAERGTVHWVTVGSFFSSVLFMAPIYSEYLHRLSVCTYNEVNEQCGLKISRYYRPFEWMPHTTIGKHFSPEQLRTAFEVLQNQFVPMEGMVTRIGLARTNPYEDIEMIVLK